MRLARTAAVLTMIGAAGTGSALGAVVMAGGAAPAAAASAPSFSISPSVGSPGSAFVATFSGFYGEVCPSIWIFWNGVEIASGQALQKTLVAHVPTSARVGRHYVKAMSGCYESGLVPFDVVPPTTTPPPTATATVPLPVPTLPTTPAGPTASPTVPPTRPPGGSTGGPTPSQGPASTTGADPSATTAMPEGEPAPAQTSGEDSTHRLVFDKPSVQAGERLSATGTGCDALSGVDLTAGGERVASAVADAAGGFTTPVEFSRVVPGRHVVTATCGTVLTGAVDVVLTSSAAAGSSSTLVVLLFFLLAAVTLIARTR